MISYTTISRKRRRRHADVPTLQQWLIEIGHKPGIVDGVFGKKVERAVINFQTNAGLKMDGVVSQQTWEALKCALSMERNFGSLESRKPKEFRIIPKHEWGARQPKQTAPLLKHVPIIYIHHTASPRPSIAGEFADARRHQDRHMDINGWNDLAYNFIITPSGRIIEGRGFGIRPAGKGLGVRRSYGIVFQGYFHPHVNEKPSGVAIEACGWLIKKMIDEEWVIPEVEIIPHRHIAGGKTVCPGNHLYNCLDDIKKEACLA
jgi:hypothetical protein